MSDEPRHDDTLDQPGSPRGEKLADEPPAEVDPAKLREKAEHPDGLRGEDLSDDAA